MKDPLNGAAFAGNIIPANRILKSTQNYLNLLPLPNYTSAANQLIAKGQYNYVFQESLNVPKRIETGRIDYNISEKTMMYFRMNYWWEDQSGNAVSAANTSWGWLPQHYTAISPSYVASVTHIVNPSTVLQGSVGYARFTEGGPPLSEADVSRQNASNHRRQHSSISSRRQSVQLGSGRDLQRDHKSREPELHGAVPFTRRREHLQRKWNAEQDAPPGMPLRREFTPNTGPR